MRWKIGVAVTATILVSVLAMAAPKAGATFAGKNGLMVFSRGGRIFTMAPDGTDQVQLTDGPGDFAPAWSPDGSKIAFVREADTGASIWVMNGDGSGAIRVSSYGRGCVQPPLWAPDGSTIAYWDVTEHGAIFVVASDGSSRRRLTDYTATYAVRGWSPDGTKLVYETDRDGDVEIWTMSPDGSDPTRLTRNGVSDFSPAFSPDGSTIVFERTNHSGRFTTIWSMHADGTGQTQLTTVRRVIDSLPAWSPDGTWIAFKRYTVATTRLMQLVRIAPDGSDLRLLTGPDTLAMLFAWSPNSARIVFIDDYRAVDVIRADGSGPRTILSSPDVVVSLPDWQAVN